MQEFQLTLKLVEFNCYSWNKFIKKILITNTVVIKTSQTN